MLNSGDLPPPAALQAFRQVANCTINVTFNPLATGARAATLSLTDNAPNSPKHSLSAEQVQQPLTRPLFTTYLGTYGSGFSQTYHGNSSFFPYAATIPLAPRRFLISGQLNAGTTGNYEYQIWAINDGSGNYALHLFNGTSNAPGWPYPTLTPSGATITLATPITLGTLQITAYRFALAGNQLQLDLSVTRTGTFNDQIVIEAATFAGNTPHPMAP